MSARLLAGAGAVLRREGLVRALDAAARRPLGHPGAVLGFVAVLVPRRGILAPVGLGRHLGLEERVHRRVGLVGRALVVDAVRRVGEAVTGASVLERLPDLHSGAREVLLELKKAVVADAVEFGMMVLHPDVGHRRREGGQVLVICVEESDGLDAGVVAWIDRSKRKRNSTFFKNMGYRGQSCDDWISLMRSFGD